MSTSPLSKGNILIIDDSEELLDVMKLILERNGYTVFIKNKPDNILKFVQENNIQLLLLDILFQDADGRDVCRELRNMTQTIQLPVIIISASPRYLVKHSECGANDFLEKPFEIKELLAKIELNLLLKN